MNRELPRLLRAGLGVALALAASAAAARVVVEDAWVRPTFGPVTTSAAYFRITSDADARLVGASSPVAAHLDLHQMTMDGNIMRMRAVDAVPLPAGRAVAFAPNGLHVMITGVKRPLKAGERVPLTLDVRDQAGHVEHVPVTATVSLAAPSSSAAPAASR